MPKIVEKKLTALSVKRMTKPGHHADGGGLYLTIKPSGTKSWTLRFRDKGKPRMIGLGPVRDVSLAEARDEAVRLRKAIKEGRDPIVERDGVDDGDESEQVPTFEQAAVRVHDEHKGGWRNPKHAAQWLSTLVTYAFPLLGKRPVDEIASGEVLEALLPIWNAKPETARRVRQRMRLVFDWAIARQYRTAANPVDALRAAMPKQPRNRGHFAALPYGELPTFILELRQNDRTHRLVRLALEFLILTACRTGEILGATWDEIDRDKAVWTVPAARMKAGVEHRVPLCDRCLEILEEAETMRVRGKSLHVFPGRRWTDPLSNMAFTMALRRMGRGDITVHGFRSSFRDWTAERTSTPRDVCEAALAHTIRDKVEAAYRRTDLFERRRLLMNDWAAFLASGEATVVQIRA